MLKLEKLRELYSQFAGAGCVVTHQDYPGKVLVVELGVNSRGNEGKISIPAGHREDGETPQETVVREVQEETGFRKIQIEHVIGMYKSGSEPGKTGIVVKGTVFGKTNFQPNDEVTRLIWEDPNVLLSHPGKLRSSTKRALEDFLNGKKLPLGELEEQLERYLQEA